MKLECPTPMELYAFSGGEIGGERFERIAAHLEPGCLTCEAVLLAPVCGPGTVLAGKYMLEAVIGEGGMGTVYRALQTVPLKREVAVKLVKAGMDSRAVLARFEAERQSLALMDHPNIAKVLDAGTTPDGRPFFAMEYVSGAAITKHCEAEQLPLSERLNLFIAVCQGVQHAHQKGVIHRDLKPGNVLVAKYDGKPVPKVIDFGVAKATGPQMTEETLTGLGTIIGTLEYMAPEQAELNSPDIDTRADVYALGVILYELLTGSTPLDRKAHHKAALLDLLRMVREVDPPPPSTRRTQSRPSSIQRIPHGSDLDCIVMKALEKDRTRRYETATALAADVRRYLADEPIEAARPTRVQRYLKFARKHRRGLASAGAVAALLVASSLYSLYFAREARRESEKRAEALTQLKAEQEQTSAELANREAVLNFFLDSIITAARPANQAGGLGIDITLRKAVELAEAKASTSLQNRPSIEAAVRATLGDSFYFLGDPHKSLAQFEKVIVLRQPSEDLAMLTAMTGKARAHMALNQHDAAIGTYQQVLTAWERKNGPDDIETLRSKSNLANAYLNAGKSGPAIELLADVRPKFRERLGPTDPATMTATALLAEAYFRNNTHPDYAARKLLALELLREVLAGRLKAFGPKHPDTLTSRHNLGVAHGALGRIEEARACFAEALSVREEVLGVDHPETQISRRALRMAEDALSRKKQ